MLDGVMLLWWILTVPSFVFVTIDVWRNTPEAPVLKWAFLSELLSMNLLMSGMQLTSRFSMAHVDDGDDPGRPEFWFIMSMALLVGFVFAYPMNWWLVAHHMKHGMLTVRRPVEVAATGMPEAAVDAPMPTPTVEARQPSARAKAAMTVLSFAILGLALAIVVAFAL